MLTKGDDYPIHQTPEPIAYAGSDRNFYDRYFFNAYAPDGGAFLAVAYGVYPALNVADAHIAIVKDGKERCLHASRVLGMERMDLSVGPIALDIAPLRSSSSGRRGRPAPRVSRGGRGSRCDAGSARSDG